MNNDELQKAIDDITRDTAAPAAAAPTTAAVAENDQLADELEQVTTTAVPEVDLGVAPAPVVPEDPAMPPAAEPVVETPAAVTEEVAAPVAEPAPVVEEVAEAPAEPVVEAVEPVAPVEEAAPVADDATLEEALKELYPLLDKVDLPAQEKFDITMRVGEPSRALEYAKKIADDTAKANALLAIVEKLK